MGEWFFETDPDENLHDALLRWIELREERLNDLEKDRVAIEAEISRIRRSLQSAIPFATSLGIDIPMRVMSTQSEDERSTNRLPPRLPEFADYTIANAVGIILEERPNAGIHADYFVRRIFDSGTPAQNRAAKSSVVPALSAGARDGKWTRVAPNTFSLLKRREEPVAVNDEAPP